MAKTDVEKAIPPPLTTEAVQKLIDAAILVFEIRHGHVGAEDGEKMLAALKADDKD